jgi:hypothetical protein
MPNASYHEYINWFDALYQEHRDARRNRVSIGVQQARLRLSIVSSVSMD